MPGLLLHVALQIVEARMYGGAIGIHASLSLVRSLLAAGAIDELSLVIAPVIVDGGRKLLDGVPGKRLELISSVTSPTGHLLVDYRGLK